MNLRVAYGRGILRFARRAHSFRGLAQVRQQHTRCSDVVELAEAKGETPETAAPGYTGCQLVSIVSIDERGQLILPKELRVKAGIQAGDKLLVAYSEKDGEMFFLTLMKVDLLSDKVRDTLGPLMQEML